MILDYRQTYSSTKNIQYLSSNRASQNLKEEDLDLNSSDYEKEGKNQGKNFLTLRVRILTLILTMIVTLQGKNSYPDSYPDSYPANIFPLASSPTLASCPSTMTMILLIPLPCCYFWPLGHEHSLLLDNLTLYGDIRWGDFRSNRLELSAWVTYAGTMVTAIIQRCSGTTDENGGNIITKERDDGSNTTI